MELQSWTESWKMKQQTPTPRPQIMYEAEQKPKLMRHFSILFGGWGGEKGIISHLFRKTSKTWRNT